MVPDDFLCRLNEQAVANNTLRGRVDELLAANNALVERAREAEARADKAEAAHAGEQDARMLLLKDFAALEYAFGEQGLALKDKQRWVRTLLRADATKPPLDDPDSLYRQIAHGDEEHRRWLREALDAYAAGKPVPAPRQGPSERDKAYIAEIDRLRAERGPAAHCWCPLGAHAHCNSFRCPRRGLFPDGADPRILTPNLDRALDNLSEREAARLAQNWSA